ncbi:uncharacterized protein LOC119905550 isoform X2 [Micropterus salmoides]|uniref:uncharacterized protein LOC119905550 isoform X2 n=1 Tax=Micropterus salmoides TaxID=27706 RepID=UPI0018EBBEC2|nr:uncharacterized protein LOC119905550 isoform X2 [Micropterus salmoides]
MEDVLTKLTSGNLRTYTAVILMFTYNILLDMDFACTCKPQVFDCTSYLVLPVLIIFIYILWTDRSFQRVFRYMCSGAFGCRSRPHICSFLGSFLRKLLKALLVGLLWVAFVYIDGDWYVCCKNDGSEQQAQLACKDKRRITEKEQVLIAEVKNKSRVIGGVLLFGIILMASLMPLCRWTKCCGKSSSCNRKLLKDKLILEEEENVLIEILRKSVKEKLTTEVEERIRGKQWEECFDVAEELIKRSKANISEEEQQQEPRNLQENQLRTMNIV